MRKHTLTSVTITGQYFFLSKYGLGKEITSVLFRTWTRTLNYLFHKDPFHMYSWWIANEYSEKTLHCTNFKLPSRTHMVYNGKKPCYVTNHSYWRTHTKQMPGSVNPVVSIFLLEFHWSLFLRIHLVTGQKTDRVLVSQCQLCLSQFSWNTVSVRYTHFHVEIFWQLMSLPKCTSISIKIYLRIFGCIIYNMAYNLRQSWSPILKMATLNTVTTRLFTSLCFSLWMYLIVTSREFLVREQCVNVIII